AQHMNSSGRALERYARPLRAISSQARVSARAEMGRYRGLMLKKNTPSPTPKHSRHCGRPRLVAHPARINLIVDRDVLARVAVVAASEDRSLTSALRRLIAAGLTAQPEAA